MDDHDRTDGQGGEALGRLRRRVAELERREREYQRADRAIREAEDNLKAVIDASPESAFLIDAEGRILVCNAVAAHRVGLTPEGMAGRNIFDLIPPEVAAGRRRYVEQVLQTGEPLVFEDCRWERIFRHHLQPVRDAGGRVHRLAIFGQDITEERVREETLRGQRNLLESIRRAQELFISGREPRLVYEELLHLLVEVTGSGYGFLDEVLREPDGTPYKLNLALSDIAWDGPSKDLYHRLKDRQLAFRDLENLAGAPVLEGRTVIANDVAGHPRYRGLPPGHPPLTSYMGIPLCWGDELIGVAAVANRPGGYSEALAESLRPLIQACGALIWADRLLRRERESLEALQESEEKYRRIAQTANEGIWSMDGDRRTTYVNRRMGEMLGYRPEEMLGRRVDDFMFPEDRADHAAQMALRQRGEGGVYERRFRRREGGEVWTIVSATALRGAEGFAGSFAMFTDITDRKRMEADLRRSEATYRALVEGLPDTIMRFDREGRHLFVSGDVEALTGIPKGDFLGRTHRELGFPEPLCDLWEGAIGRVCAQGTSFETEFTYPGKTGEATFDWRLLPERDAAGRVQSVLSISRDVTAQRRAERAYQTLFREMLNGFALHEILCDDRGRPADYRFLDVNPAFERMTGLTGADIAGRTVREVLPDTETHWIETYGRVALTGEPAHFERYSRELGRYFEVTAFRPAPGQFACIVQDVTERRRAEEERRRNQEELERLALELGVIAEIGRIIGSTLEIETVYDRFAAEARKLVPFDGVSVSVLDPEGASVTISYVAGIEIPGRGKGDRVPLAGTFTALVMAQRKGFRFSSTRREELNRLFPGLNMDLSPRAGVHSNMVVPLFERNRVIGTLHFRSRQDDAYTEEHLRLAERIGTQIAGAIANAALFRDLARTEKALREGEERYRLLFENSPDGIVILDPETARPVAFNETVCRQLGYTHDEFASLSIADIDVAESPAETRARIARVIQEGRNDFETLQRTRQGEIRNVQVTALFTTLGGKQVYHCIWRDVTEQRRGEEERRALAERLQQAEKMEALGTLAGGVAHDLNNVLGIVVGYAEMLLDEQGEVSPLREDLRKIMDGGHRSAAIVQDLLTLARRGVQTRKVVNLNAAILECQKTPEFQRMLTYNPRVRFQLDLEPNLLNLLGSPVHLAKTLINLVNNAIEAMPEGGTVTVRTENRYLDRPVAGYEEVREGDYVVLTVADTGEGIPERDRRRIFEPFYTKKVMGRSGTGLGLAVVWGTVKDHNGYIRVESEEGKGTVFTCYFPVTREGGDGEEIPASRGAYMGRGETVLVVDDVREQRDLASRMLMKLNYRVIAVAGGEEALDYLRSSPVDLVVLDMIMDPGMDGLETYEAILKVRPGQKAIIVSGFSESERVHRAQQLGAGAYVKKPYLLEKIGLAVREALDRN